MSFKRMLTLQSLSFVFILIQCIIAVAGNTSVNISVCGGFTDGGLSNDDCCYNEAFGIQFAKIAWDRGILPRLPGDVTGLFSYVDTEGDPGQAISCAFAGWQTDNSALVLGGGWSSLTKPMAQLGGSLGGAQLDWGGTADELSDPKIYPLLTRVAAPDASIAIGLAELLVQQYLSSRIVIIYETGEWGQDLTSKLTEELRNLDPRIDLKLVPLMLKPTSGDEEILRSKFLQVKGQLYRHFVVISLETVVFQVLAEDQFSYILGPYTFLLGPGDVRMGMNGLDKVTMLKFAGMQILESGFEDIGSNLTLLSDLWMSLTADDFPEPLRSIIPCTGGSTSAKVGCWWEGNGIFSNNDMMTDQYFTLAFDAGWLLLTALQNLANDGKTTSEMKGELLHDTLLKTSTSGLTGRIRLRDNGDRVLPIFDLKYLDSTGDWQIAAKLESVSKHLTIIRDPIYADSSKNRPADSFQPCSAGHFRNGTNCTAAPPGFFIPQGLVLGAPLECAMGTYSAGLGNALCSECSPGRFQNSTGQSNCQDCPELSFTESSGQVACKTCPEGHVQAEGGHGCSRCEIGRYRSANDMSCIDCPTGRATEFMAATTSLDCKCKEGLYWDGDSCTACLVGMTCPFGSDSTPTASVHPLLQASYWSSVAEPLSVYRCASERRCPGGEPGVCNAKLVGQSCTHCDDGWAWNGQKCIRCSSVETSAVLFPLLPILLFPILILLLYKLYGDRYFKWESWQNGCTSLVFVILNHYQVIALAKDANIDFPIDITNVWEVVSISGDPSTIFNLDCAGYSDFQSSLIMKSVSPAIISVMFVITFAFSRALVHALRNSQFGMLKDRTLNAYFGLIFTFFPGIVAMAFTIFKCNSNPNGKLTLMADRSVTCQESDWNGMLVVGILSTALWCFGFGVLFARIVYVAPHHFVDEAFQMRWKFLFIKFRPDVYWFSLIIVAKGIIMNFGLVFLNTGVAQIFWLLAICAVYLGIIVTFRPWRHLAVNAFDTHAHICLLVLLAALSWFSKDDLSGDESNRHMSNFVIALSFLLVPMLLPVVWQLVSTRVSSAQKETKKARAFRMYKAFNNFGSGPSVESWILTLNEWEFWFMKEAALIIEMEYIGVRDKLSRQKRCSPKNLEDRSIPLSTAEGNLQADLQPEAELKPHTELFAAAEDNSGVVATDINLTKETATAALARARFDVELLESMNEIHQISTAPSPITPRHVLNGVNSPRDAGQFFTPRLTPRTPRF